MLYDRPMRPEVLIDLTGQQFGRWHVDRYEKHYIGNHRKTFWHCTCECGQTSLVLTKDLRSGKSTGCRKCHVKTHGHTGTKIYNVWRAMIARCNNPDDARYKYYGGRGITVCARWLKFENFLKDMGIPPTGLSIERMDNERGYSKKNCKWATHTEQMRNRRNSRR